MGKCLVAKTCTRILTWRKLSNTTQVILHSSEGFAESYIMLNREREGRKVETLDEHDS